MGPKSNITRVLIRRGIDTEERRPFEDGGRDWSDVSTSEMPRIAGNPGSKKRLEKILP